MSYREELENDMKKISVKIIKKALGKIKRTINEKFKSDNTPLSKMKRSQLLDKIIELNYKYNKEKNELTTDSMIRKPKRIKLNDLS
tara:strand:+ start:73 stop:330 length:258 start_codon:yes stop_codon:yes gene_type:complete